MAYVYILYSKSLHSHYIGSCKNLKDRLFEHNNGTFENSFTTKAKELGFLLAPLLNYKSRYYMRKGQPDGSSNMRIIFEHSP